MSETKACIVCAEIKPVDQYLLHWNGARQKHYRRGDCRECRNAKRRANVEHKARAAALKRERYADPEYRARFLDAQHKWRMGITRAEKMEMLAEQGDRCAACGAAETTGHDWATDHDHACCPGNRSCGACIRGILCQPCNLALGQARESVERLQGLINYLQRNAPSTKGNDMADWPSKQPKPQARNSTSFDADEAGTPVTGFDAAPVVAQPSRGPGKGVPASKKVIR